MHPRLSVLASASSPLSWSWSFSTKISGPPSPPPLCGIRRRQKRFLAGASLGLPVESSRRDLSENPLHVSSFVTRSCGGPPVLYRKGGQKQPKISLLLRVMVTLSCCCFSRDQVSGSKFPHGIWWCFHKIVMKHMCFNANDGKDLMPPWIISLANKLPPLLSESVPKQIVGLSRQFSCVSSFETIFKLLGREKHELKTLSKLKCFGYLYMA